MYFPREQKHNGYPETTNATDNNNLVEINRREKGVNTCLGTSCHGSETDPWQLVPRQVFTPFDCLLISVEFVVSVALVFSG